MSGIKKCIAMAGAGTVLGFVAHELTSGRDLREKLRKKEIEWEKMKEFYFILLQWVRVHQENRSLKDYFVKNKYKTVAIYGMKELGEALLEELKDGEIEVRYGIDKDADTIYAAADVYKPDEELDDVDVVVVTAVHYFDEIKNELQKKHRVKIVSIEDVVWEA